MRRITFLFLSFSHCFLFFLLLCFFLFVLYLNVYVCLCIQVSLRITFFVAFVLHPTRIFLKSLQMGNCLTEDDKQKICNRKLHTPPTLQRGIYRLEVGTSKTKQNTMKSSASFPQNNLFCFISFGVVSMLKFLITLLSRTFME